MNRLIIPIALNQAPFRSLNVDGFHKQVYIWINRNGDHGAIALTCV
jgi:hypothetical protein